VREMECVILYLSALFTVYVLDDAEATTAPANVIKNYSSYSYIFIDFKCTLSQNTDMLE